MKVTLLELGIAARALANGGESGDECLVREISSGVLVAVLDALGHGPEAAVVSRQATSLLAAAQREHPLAAVRLCHEGLRHSRGVVLGMAWFDPAVETMTWLGVGNVAGILVRGDRASMPRIETLVSRHGVVGRQLPALHAGMLHVAPGDTLVLATDGIDPEFMRGRFEPAAPEATAKAILEKHGTGNDDALVLVARYKGTSP